MTESPQEQVLRVYRHLEPDRSDTWNPVANDLELGYRMALLYCLTQALRFCELPLSELRVLDVGTGNGRSARMHLDLGLHPTQITGIDLRPGAIDLARALNPAISFRVQEGDRIDADDGAYTWVQATTVLGSIKGGPHRRALVDEMVRVLAPGGYLFLFDGERANGFAGGDRMDLPALTPGVQHIWTSRIVSHRSFPRHSGRLTLLRHDRTLKQQVKASLRPWLGARTWPRHQVLLARRP